MSDYISREETIKALRNYAEQKHYGGETVLANGILKAVCFIEKEENIPTLDEKEIIRKAFERVVERLKERTKHLKDCTKYGNKNVEQQEKSYSTVMLYEVADLVEDLIGIVKEEGGIE